MLRVDDKHLNAALVLVCEDPLKHITDLPLNWDAINICDLCALTVILVVQHAVSNFYYVKTTSL